MIRQMTFSELEEVDKPKVTRKAQFIKDMNAIVPWQRLNARIEPFYPKGTRRPTIGFERISRFYFLQQWFGFADEATEEAVIDTQIFRQFVGIDLSRETVPDATTLLPPPDQPKTKQASATLKCTYEEEYVFADAGYTGVEKRPEHRTRKVQWEVAKRRSSVRGGWKKVEHIKSSIRSKVEHMFGIVKCRFHYRKAHYKGLYKNACQLNVLFALANMVKMRRSLLSSQDNCA